MISTVKQGQLNGQEKLGTIKRDGRGRMDRIYGKTCQLFFSFPRTHKVGEQCDRDTC